MRRFWMSVGLVLVLVAPAGAQVTVKGDAKVWQEVIAAYDKLAKVKTYRMKMTVEGQPTAIMIEHVNPDRSRSVIKVEQMTMETVVVGSESRYRVNMPGAPSTWQCNKPQQRTELPADVKSAKGDVTISRVADATIEGARTAGYEYTWVAQGTTVKQRLFAATSDWLPRCLLVLDAAGKPETTIDYYDFNAPITIQLERCG